jgi:hypothetical protein
MQRLVIIDYGSGNLHSAAKAFERAARESEADALRVVRADIGSPLPRTPHVDPDQRHVPRSEPGDERIVGVDADQYRGVESLARVHVRALEQERVVTRLRHAMRSREVSLKEAAYQVMPEAYRKASNNGRLPANARRRPQQEIACSLASATTPMRIM